MAARLRDSSLRHANYYLQLLGRADSLYLEGGASREEALSLFGEEWENIHRGQGWAEQQTDKDRAAASCCSLCADAGAFIFSFKLHALERLRWLEAALTAARRLGDQATSVTSSCSVPQLAVLHFNFSPLDTGFVNKAQAAERHELISQIAGFSKND
jgi:hypothetical protein